MRDGLEDYEYFYELAGGQPQYGSDNAADSIVQKIITGQFSFNRDSEYMYNLRKVVGYYIGGEIGSIPQLVPTSKHSRSDEAYGNSYYINFQDPSDQPNANPLIVDGDEYMKIGNNEYSESLGYGWIYAPDGNLDNTGTAYDYDQWAEWPSGTEASELQKSAVLDDYGRNNVFDFDLPNGTYDVTLGVGNRNFLGEQRVLIEGELFLDSPDSSSTQWYEVAKEVTVSDKRLTVEMGKFNKMPFINYLKIEAQSEPEINTNPLNTNSPDYDFGDLQILTTTTTTVEILNEGTADLIVSDINVGDTTNYSLNLNPVTNPCGGANPTIGAGSSCNVEVSFNPQTVGEKTTTLNIDSNDSDEATYVLELRGNGIDNTTPTITSITTTTPNGAYAIGDSIEVTVNFSENVTSSGNVTVTLETGATDRTCTFTATDQNTATCTYTVQAGDESGDLTVNSVTGTVTDADTNPLDNTLPSGQNLADNADIAVDGIPPVISINAPTNSDMVNASTLLDFSVTDGTASQCSLDSGSSWEACSSGDALGVLTSFNAIAEGAIFTLQIKDQDTVGNEMIEMVTNLEKEALPPTITSITTTTPNGAYAIGDSIEVTVNFSENVTSSGNVTVTLETGATDRTCTFTATDQNTATCTYTVQAGDESGDLTVNSVTGTVTDADTNPLDNTLPSGQNLADNADIAVDGIPPVISITSPTGSMTVDGTTPITFTSSGNAPTCSFDGGLIWVACASGQTLDQFPQFTNLAEGDTFNLQIKDQDIAGNETIETVATLLRQDNDPYITNILAISPNGYYGIGAPVTIQVNFSELITTTGDLTLTLNNGATCTISQITGNQTSANCVYTPMASEDVVDLSVATIAGVIEDQTANQINNPIVPTGQNLADNANIVIDTVAPNGNVLTTGTDNGPEGQLSFNSNENNSFVYIVIEGAPQANLADLINASATNEGRVKHLPSAGTNYIMETINLEAGAYNVYLVDSAGNIKQLAEQVNVAQTVVVEEEDRKSVV